MSQKEGALEEFLRSLRVALINASIYREGHPVFRKSIKDLKNRLDNLLPLSSYIEIGIKPDALFIEGKILKDSKLYKDIAAFFHLRMIMSVKIEGGITEEELSSFFLEVANSPKRIVELGGIKKLIEKKMITNVVIRELDYSPLLGRVNKATSGDVWNFLLEEAQSLKSGRKDTDTFLRNFEYILEKADFSQLSRSTHLRERLKNVVNNVKKELSQRVGDVDKSLLKTFLRKKDQLDNNKLSELVNVFFKDISAEKAVEALWEEVFENKNFNPLAFSVFDQLIDRNKKEDVVSLWNKKLAEEDVAKDPLIKNKVKELLVLQEESIYLPKIYHDTIAFLSQGIKEESKFMLDQNSLLKSYTYVLLNIFSSIKDISLARALFALIFDNWERVKELKDFNLLRCLCETVTASIETASDSLRDFIEEQRGRLLSLIEGFIVDEVSEMDEENFNYFLDCIEKSSFDYTYYLEKIWSYNDPHRYLIKLFYKLFPNAWDIFLARVKKDASNIRLIKQAINVLKDIDSIKSFNALKEIFYYANPFVKLEIVKVLKSFSSVETEFILDNLKSSNSFIKKETIDILKSKDKELRRQGAKVLLNIFNPLGINNRYLIENIRLIGEAGLQEAEEFLHSLLKKKFLWKARELKEEINWALAKLNEVSLSS